MSGPERQPVTVGMVYAFEAGMAEGRGGSLDAAWAEAEAALPHGWRVVDVRWLTGKWRAEARSDDAKWVTGQLPTRPGDWPLSGSWQDPPSQWGMGDTPAAALRELAAALRDAVHDGSADGSV